MHSEHKIETSTNDTSFDTNRWTSPIFRVQFGSIGTVEPEPDQEAAFRISAWGLSKNLRYLLKDYAETHIKQSAEWLTIQQNAMIADVLEQMQYADQSIPSLEQLFIAIDGELYLPNGLRMYVTCVTNIVPHGIPVDGLDKFVAILDPGETISYVTERKGVAVPSVSENIH